MSSVPAVVMVNRESVKVSRGSVESQQRVGRESVESQLRVSRS